MGPRLTSILLTPQVALALCAPQASTLKETVFCSCMILTTLHQPSAFSGVLFQYISGPPKCNAYLIFTRQLLKCEKERRWPTGIPPALCAAEVTRITPLKSLLIMVALKLFAFSPVGSGELI